VRIHAFAGLRYAVAGAGALAAPPFDQIDDAARDRLHRIPHHFAHLTRPVAASDPSPAAHAAALHAAWLAEGVIVRDPEPTLYGYSIDLPDGRRRWSLTALVGLEPPESGVVRPHERTVERTVDERLALLAATRVDLEPIMLLADDGGALERLVAEDGLGPHHSTATAHVDEFGNHHRSWPLPPHRTERYREALATATALIADGHHRWRTACRYAAEHGIAQGAASAKLAVSTSLASPTLTIDPIHRGIAKRLLPTQNQLSLSRLPSSAATGAALAAEVAAAPQPALAIVATGARPEIWHLDPAAAPADLAPGAARLPAVLLDRVLLPAWGLPAAAATDGTLVYRSDPEVLWAAVRSGELAAGVWLPPMTPAAFHAAVADGGLLPPKSTRFLPKVASGLVWCPHDAALA
jgi:uncharacterized protein (DUF1015 family)